MTGGRLLAAEERQHYRLIWAVIIGHGFTVNCFLLVALSFRPCRSVTVSHPIHHNLPLMTDEFPSALVGPSSKERKYDRQLRLWAASGQQALEDSRVLLINNDGPWSAKDSGVAGVAGVETLKNLVLPGIGGFTIVDPAVVTEADLGVNFFLEEESLGKSRAEETCRWLKELNPDVDGSFHSKVHPVDPSHISPRETLMLINIPTAGH